MFEYYARMHSLRLTNVANVRLIALINCVLQALIFHNIYWSKLTTYSRKKRFLCLLKGRLRYTHI